MTNITPEMQEQLARAVGFRRQTLEDLPPKFRHEGNLGWVCPDNSTGHTLPDLTDPTNWFKWVAPKLLSENSSSFDLYVFLGGAIVKVREHGKTVAVTDEELPGHALFLAARELLCKEERE
uniref:Uncharacterized protein n=1 Tax=viral metagenome TaxID=1070528 RepID=A0A6M3KYZ9_9ZZZZ